MATVRSVAFSCSISQDSRHLSSISRLGSFSLRLSSQCTFSGQSFHLLHRQWPAYKHVPSSRTIKMMAKPTIQFIQGTDELTVPDVRLTKSKDGTNGVAFFRFEQPSVFDSSGEFGEITGFYMKDEEGTLQSVDVNAKFVNGKPAAIEAKYTMRSPREWDRFMRFMERYSNDKGLQFVKN